jgi:hypothetical protein
MIEEDHLLVARAKDRIRRELSESRSLVRMIAANK